MRSKLLHIPTSPGLCAFYFVCVCAPMLRGLYLKGFQIFVNKMECGNNIGTGYHTRAPPL